MITQKRITIPIFDYKLTIIIYDRWDEVEHLFDGGPEPKAITAEGYGSAITAINSKREPLTNEQKERLFQDEDYVDTYTKIQGMVNAEILTLVKARIESTAEGKELLEHQLKVVKKLKGKIIDDTNREMEMFRRFREFSKQNPGITYEEFIKANM